MKYKNCALLLLSLLPVNPARADWIDDALLFAGGLAAGFVVHELGHELAARAYGEKLEWYDGKLTCRWPCHDLDKIALAGNLATAITGEILLHTQYRNTFVDGVQTFNTVNPISYAYKDSVTPGGYGDYANVNDTTQIALAIHAASIGYRHVAGGKWRFDIAGRRVQWSINFF